MDKIYTHNEAVELLQKAVDSGEITFEEAQSTLNDYDEYLESLNEGSEALDKLENITLEEAMENISDYLAAAANYVEESGKNCSGYDTKHPTVNTKDIPEKHFKFKELQSDPNVKKEWLHGTHSSDNSRTNTNIADKLKITKESVNDLRLRVFEAYEAGKISEEDKNVALEYLNLDNYE